MKVVEFQLQAKFNSIIQKATHTISSKRNKILIRFLPRRYLWFCVMFVVMGFAFFILHRLMEQAGILLYAVLNSCFSIRTASQQKERVKDETEWKFVKTKEIEEVHVWRPPDENLFFGLFIVSRGSPMRNLELRGFCKF